MEKVKKILAMRLSAMGDVSLTVPAIRAVLESNPDIEITLVTRKFFAPFFYGIPRLKLFFPDLNGRHKGFFGLFRLFKDLKKLDNFSAVIDLHRVIRTRILSELFSLTGKPAFAIDKGRKEKKYLLKTKYLRFLRHSSERYLEAFERAGLKGKIGKAPYIRSSEEVLKKAEEHLLKHSSGKDSIKIGLAPFATHKTKIWGTDKFKELITLINREHQADFYLFGGGEKEISELKQLQQFGSNIHLVAGNLNLAEEIGLVKKLDLMISMDSSNMHLAALSGIPTISIWGGTHPVFGFYALGQPAEYHIQIPASSLKCRPCSVYGAKPCIYPEPLCLERVKAADVYSTLQKFDLLKTKSVKTVPEQSVHPHS
jgi:ADP-heptose:LPS heptosyltransferase